MDYAVNQNTEAVLPTEEEKDTVKQPDETAVADLSDARNDALGVPAIAGFSDIKDNGSDTRTVAMYQPDRKDEPAELNFAVNDPMPQAKGDAKKDAPEPGKAGAAAEEEDESYGSQATRAMMDGDLDKAEKLWLKQLKADEDTKDPGKIGCTTRAIAGLYLDQGNTTKAKEYTEKAIGSFEKMEKTHPMKDAMLGSMHHYMGEILKDDGRRRSAAAGLTKEQQGEIVFDTLNKVEASLRKSKEHLDKVDPKAVAAVDPEKRVLARVHGTYQNIAQFMDGMAKYSDKAKADELTAIASDCRKKASGYASRPSVRE